MTENSNLIPHKYYWVAHGLDEELHIMSAFISQQSKQIEDYRNNIEKYVEVAEVEKWYYNGPDEGDVVLDEVQHIEGFSEDDYDFKALFTEVMPAYQRQAMLVTLWARLEAKLDDIVRYLADSLKKAKRKKPKGVSDFQHLINEIERLGVKFGDSEEVRSAITTLNNSVRLIRNSWVHNGGRPSHNVEEHIAHDDGLSIDSGYINVSGNYLKFVLKNMRIISRHILDELVIKDRNKQWQV
jgi:hypothetical protein